ncbi:hypothetical protein [Moraxella pluranimalium]|uniref:hypothetical protein n=1 Tax=Moraxella pluranimalium TaxID=470453 RepID=UPI00117DF2EB|nr:hypothetical protein [Moraxella pluranimalium]
MSAFPLGFWSSLIEIIRCYDRHCKHSWAKIPPFLRDLSGATGEFAWLLAHCGNFLEVFVKNRAKNVKNVCLYLGFG